MKTLLALLFPAILSAQVYQSPNIRTERPVPYDWGKAFKRAALPGAMAFTSGAVGGLHEALLWRKDVFFRRFPSANRQFWDHDVSWRNKKILGAANDAYHWTQRLHTWGCYSTGVCSSVVIATNWQGKPNGHRMLDIGTQAAVTGVGYWLGSIIVYNLIFHR